MKYAQTLIDNIKTNPTALKEFVTLYNTTDKREDRDRLMNVIEEVIDLFLTKESI